MLISLGSAGEKLAFLVVMLRWLPARSAVYRCGPAAHLCFVVETFFLATTATALCANSDVAMKRLGNFPDLMAAHEIGSLKKPASKVMNLCHSSAQPSSGL